MINNTLFTKELIEAGLAGLPFTWDFTAGTLDLSDDRLNDQQRAAIKAVLQAHDPNGPMPPQEPSVEDRLAKLEQQVAQLLGG